MQTLMCAPLRPAEIIVGKFLTVWSMALIAALANVASLAATLSRIVPGQPLTVPPSAYVLTFLMLVPVTFIIAAVFLAVAAFARSRGFRGVISGAAATGRVVTGLRLCEHTVPSQRSWRFEYSCASPPAKAV